jgi:hypothetical protein
MAWMIARLKYDDNLSYLSQKQNDFSLIPLSEYGNQEFIPPISFFNEEYVFEPFQKVQEMSLEIFFNTFNNLASTNPGTDADKPALERFEKIGVGAGLVFSIDRFPPATRQALEKLSASVIQKLSAFSGGYTVTVNGWEFWESTVAKFGTDYEFRAGVALTALGTNPVKMSVYPSARLDSDLKPLDGNNNYLIHFEAGQFPPCDAFWSITVYDLDWFLVPNENNKYAIRDLDNFVKNSDGSVDIYLQHEPPSELLYANWLPVPKGLFVLTMRIYLPHESVLNWTWEPPVVSFVN